MPLVSVVVPNYNHARFLEHRIESVLGQTFTDFELIILDDASTDHSRDIINRYLTDPRVSFFPSAANSGSPFVQWNRGVAAARGEFIWIAESDDYADASFLSVLVPLLVKSPVVGLVYCQSNHVDENDVNHGPLVGWSDDLDRDRWRQPFTNEGPDECARFLLWKNTILNASAVVFRRSTFLAAGGAPTHLRQCGDWLTWVNLLLISSVCFEPRALNFFRAHGGNVRSSTSAAVFHCERCSVQRHILSRVSVPRQTRREICRRALGSFRALATSSPSTVSKRELLACLSAMLPLLARCPLYATGSVLKHFLRI